MKNNFKILPGIKKERKSDDLYFAIHNGSLLVKKKENTIEIPCYSEINELKVEYKEEFFLGELKGRSCIVVNVVSEITLSNDFELMNLREFGDATDEEMFIIAGRASQILNWDRTHKFCGKCGHETEDKEDEMAKICPSCNNVMYPVICPAIIVAVTKGDEILLAHNRNFMNNMYSLIAGFVEAGEDLESAVKREVFEEVGIKIKNVTYYKSAPWPFPNSLMFGFFAEYESGEIKVDGEEILDAHWYKKDEFPTLPKKVSLARTIIDEFIKSVNESE